MKSEPADYNGKIMNYLLLSNRHISSAPISVYAYKNHGIRQFQRKFVYPIPEPFLDSME